MLKEPHIIDVSTLGLLGIHGGGAKALLQGQLTCHMDHVNDQSLTLAAHCNPKGRVISFGRLFLYENSYYFQMPLESVAIAMNALQKYAVFFKATLSDDSQKFSRVIAKEAPIGFHQGLILPYYAGFKEYISTHPFEGGNDSFTWKHLDIAANIPNIYPETTEKFLPHELNLHEIGAISFNKGCFTGQEIIARMQYRGKLKTSLHHGIVHEKPLKGQDIYDELGKPTGMIVDFCSHENEYEVLFTSQSKASFLDSTKTHRIHNNISS